MAVASPDTARSLPAWIREHRVCWETSPCFEMHRGERVPVGFCLTLLAQPGQHGPLDPGREECGIVFDRLEEIARQAIPAEARSHVEPYDASFHLRPETGWAPEVELRVEVLHREGRFEPLDESERECLAVIRRRLAGMGVPQGSWGSEGTGRT